jgi:hypothetical protein
MPPEGPVKLLVGKGCTNALASEDLI